MTSKNLKLVNNYFSQLIGALCLLAFSTPLKTIAQDGADPTPTVIPNALNYQTPADITEIFIRGAALESPLKDLSTSASVVSSKTIQERGDDHFQNVIDLIPNLNWAGGSNRPRFFQIRGIGELEQYEGAPNPSVGFLIDDIDLSGIGGVATTFDIDQIEVFRGPQSIRYGANALAGVIDMRSADPTSFSTGKAEIGTGSDEMYEGGLAVGGPLAGTNKKLLFRFSAYHHYNDGFRDNPFLSRDDTNKREETTTRGKIRWLVSDNITADLTLFGINANNGYDAFTIDNSFTTESDRPGKDDQTTKAGALRVKFKLPNDVALDSISTRQKSDTEYSYDGDWGNNDFWQPYSPYDYFSQTFRTRETISQEFRLYSDDASYKHGESLRWVNGLYFQRLREDSNINQFQDGFSYDQLQSSYQAKTGALFGQVEMPVVSGTSLTFGLRAETRRMEYNDSKDAAFDPNNNMFGGNISLNHDLSDAVRAYALISRGFKGGGFNANPNVSLDRKQYDPEYLWNYEMGVKGSWFDNILQTNLSVFYAQRNEVQVKLAEQNDPSDPLAFTYLTDNAASGNNMGLELESVLRVTRKLNFMISGGLLDTQFDDFEYAGRSLSGRQQSHAPNWQYSVGPQYSFTENLFVRAAFTGKDAFYFDDSNDQKSKSYGLVNLSTGYKTQSWTWTFWVRNLFDERYATRGFFFGNEPPDFENKQYIQLGDPRQIGTTVVFNF